MVRRAVNAKGFITKSVKVILNVCYSQKILCRIPLSQYTTNYTDLLFETEFESIYSMCFRLKFLNIYVACINEFVQKLGLHFFKYLLQHEKIRQRYIKNIPFLTLFPHIPCMNIKDINQNKYEEPQKVKFGFFCMIA